MNSPTKQRFPLGKVVATPLALEMLAQSGETPQAYLNRHVAGDWGELDADDIAANEQALQNDERLLSAYKLAAGGKDKLWIISEAEDAGRCWPACDFPLAFTRRLRCRSLSTSKKSNNERNQRDLSLPPFGHVGF
jgi:hypothetical protein